MTAVETRLFALVLAAVGIAPGLFARAAAEPAGIAKMDGPAILLQDPAKAAFAPVPGVPQCVSMAVLRGDLAATPATVMVRMKSGCVVPYHWHTPSEELIVLQGAPLGQMKGERSRILKVGSYSQLPSHHTHRFRCDSKADCVLALVTGGAFDIHFVGDDGKDITTADALKIAAATSKTRW